MGRRTYCWRVFGNGWHATGQPLPLPATYGPASKLYTGAGSGTGVFTGSGVTGTVTGSGSTSMILFGFPIFVTEHIPFVVQVVRLLELFSHIIR